MPGHPSCYRGLNMSYDSDKWGDDNAQAVAQPAFRRESAEISLASVSSDRSQGTPHAERFAQGNRDNAVAAHELAAGVDTARLSAQSLQPLWYSPDGSTPLPHELDRLVADLASSPGAAAFDFSTLHGLAYDGHASATTPQTQVNTHMHGSGLCVQTNDPVSSVPTASRLGQNAFNRHNNNSSSSSSARHNGAAFSAGHTHAGNPRIHNNNLGSSDIIALNSGSAQGAGLPATVPSRFDQGPDNAEVILATAGSAAPQLASNGPAHRGMAQDGAAHARACVPTDSSVPAGLPALTTPRAVEAENGACSEPAFGVSGCGPGDDDVSESTFCGAEFAGLGIPHFDSSVFDTATEALPDADLPPLTEQLQGVPRSIGTACQSGASAPPFSSAMCQAPFTTAAATAAGSSARPVHADGEDMLANRLVETPALGTRALAPRSSSSSPQSSSSTPSKTGMKSKPRKRRRKRPRMAELPPDKQDKQRIKARLNARRRRAHQVQVLQELEQRAAELLERQEQLQLQRARLTAHRDLEIERVVELLHTGHMHLPGLAF